MPVPPSDSPTRTIPPADPRPEMVTATLLPPDGEPHDHTVTHAPTGVQIHFTRPFEGPESPTEFPTPDDRYTKQDFIARGGMGEVWTAWDRVLNRTVAVKILREDLKDRSFVASRFVEEARITGKLEHPGIPPIHDLGTFRDGRPFIAMKFIKDGHTLAEILTKARPDLAELLRIFDHVCQAVAAAHDKRVIHRDLKPGNVMVGRFNEVQVMDWGLAKVLGELPLSPDSKPPSEHPTAAPVSIIESDRDPSSHTRAGSLLGTPAYMPPEQAKGEVDRTDTRSDAFALGAILCELLTGRPPYWAATAAEIQALAITAQLGPAYERLDACHADPELVALAKRCLTANPDERPADAKQVAHAMAAYRSGVEERLRRAERDRAAAEAKAAEEVNTRREAEARGEERRKRHRVQLALAGTSALVVLVAIAGAWWAERQAEEKERIERVKQAELDQLENARKADAFLQRIDGEKRAQFERDRRSRNALLIEGMLAQIDGAIERDDAAAASVPFAEIVNRHAEGGADHLAPRIARCRTEIDMLAALAAADEELWNRADISWHDPKLTSGWIEAFRSYGLDYEKTPVEEWIRRINESRLRERLLLSLELWHSRRYIPTSEDTAAILRAKAERKAVRKVLDAVDPDPFRIEVRDAIPRSDRAQLDALAEDPQALRQPVRFAIVFGQIYYVPLAVRERILAPAVEKSPNNLSLLIAMSSIYQNSADVRRETVVQQLRWAQAAVAARPTSKVAWRHLARAHWDKGNLDDATANYRKALSLDPSDPFTLSNLSAIWVRRGDSERGREYAERALQLSPNYALAHNNMGSVLDRMNDVDAARSEFERAVELEPENALYHNNLGYAYYRKGEWNRAIKSFKDSLRISASFARAQVNLSAALDRKTGVEPELAPSPREKK